jgi:hypothetical protein
VLGEFLIQQAGAQAAELVAVQIVDESAHQLRPSVLSGAHAVSPQLGYHIVPIPERRTVRRQQRPL